MQVGSVTAVGNFLLIFPTRPLTILGFSFTMPGAGWGVAGAGAATATAMMVSCCIALYNGFKASNPYRIRLEGKHWYKPEGTLTRGVLKISLPAMLERLCLAPADILVSSSVALLGTASVAARSLCTTAESLSFMPAFAFQTATTTLVGQSYGAKKLALMDRFVNACLRIGSTVMFFTGLALFIFAKQIIGVFTPDQEVITIAAVCLRVEACIQVPQVIGWIYSGALRGMGNTKPSFYLNAITSWCIRAPAMVISIRLLDLTLVQAYWWIGFEIAVRSLLFHFCYRKYRKTVGEKFAQEENAA